MAELSISEASNKEQQQNLSGAELKCVSGAKDEDGDFEPTADMLVHDFDDEQTMEEEEKLQGETNFSTEIDNLTREGEMPLHELLKMYGYGVADSADSEDEGPDTHNASENGQSSSAHGKAQTNKKDRKDEDQRSSSEESPDCSRTHSTAQLLCSEPYSCFDGDGDESDDEDYIPSEEWKKEVKVGPMYQAETPTELCKYKEDEKVYENEDQLLWNPELLPENEVVEFLAEASKRVEEQTGEDAVPEMPQIKDNEEALYELIKCNFNKEEALKRLKFNPKPVKDDLQVWTEEERDGFEQEENDFNSTQADKIKLWRRKPDSHSGLADSTEQTLAEKDHTEVSRAATAPSEVSKCCSRQTASDTSSTIPDGADSCSPNPTSSRGSDRFTTDDPNISSSNPGAVRRQREDEEDLERPVKKPKVGVEFLTAAAV